MPFPLRQQSVVTQKLVGELQQVPDGTTITYADLSRAVGADVQKKNRHLLDSAKRICQREHHLVFETVLGVGQRRMRDRDVPGLGTGVRKRIRRAAHRGRRTITQGTPNPAALPRDARVQRSAEIGVLGTIEAMAGEHTAKKARAVANNDGSALTRSAIKKLYK